MESVPSATGVPFTTGFHGTPAPLRNFDISVPDLRATVGDGDPALIRAAGGYLWENHVFEGEECYRS